MKKILRLIIGVVLFFSFTSSVWAIRIGLGLSKLKVEKEVKPGETISGSLTVYNHSDIEITVKGNAQDFNYIFPFDGRKKFLPTGSVERSCANWITVSPPEITIPARGKKEVTYSIKVPPQLEKGEYWAVLFFERPYKKRAVKIGAGINIRVGSLFFLRTPDRLKQGKIEEITSSSKGIEGNLVNTGNTILVAKGDYYAMNKEGMVVDRGKIGKREYYLPPGEKVSFSLEFSDKVPVGTYTAVVTFDLQEGDVLVKEIDFVKEKTGFRVLQVRE